MFPFVYQKEPYSCGRDCLQMIIKYYRLNITEKILKQLLPTGEGGISLYSLTHGARKLGFNAIPVKCRIKELSKMVLPSIAYMNNKHYVVVFKIGNGSVLISDPANGLIIYTYERFRHEWYLQGKDYGALLVITYIPSKKYDLPI